MANGKTPGTAGKGLSRHTLVMLAGCLLPLAVLAGLWLAGVRSEYLLSGVVLLCPLAHVFMMRGRHGGARHGTDRREE